MILKKIQVISLFIIISFVIAPTNNPISNVNSEETVENFELWYLTLSGSRISEAYAFYTKQALAPLGIDVKIITKPFGQFVGDLENHTKAYPFDLAHIRFTGGGPIPSFMWAYHSTTTTYGKSIYRLNDPGWQAWQEADTGVITQEVDDLIEAIEFEFDLVKRQELINQFAELYMTKLLYDFPMVSPSIIQSMWAGYGGPNNELWIPDEGVLGSRMLGATWGEFDNYRAEGGGNSTNIRKTMRNPSIVSMDSLVTSSVISKTTLDIIASGTPSSVITENMMDSLFYIDKDWNIHPGLVWNWFVEDANADFDGNISNGLEISKNGHHKFFLRDDAFWQETTDYLGNQITSEQLDADDMLFTLEVLQYDNIQFPSKSSYRDMAAGVPYYTANTSSILYPNDTLDIWIKPGKTTPNDFLTYGKYLRPLPRHILGGQLHYIDENGTETIASAKKLNYMGINPQNTEEWKHWASIEGKSLVGPYDLIEYIPSESFSYQARDDYYYPNEWDTTKYYGNGSAFEKIEISSNILTDGDIGIFAPHINNIHPEAYYWSYGDIFETSEKEKPIDQGIRSYSNIILEDPNARILAFDSGKVDAFISTSRGVQTVEDHIIDPSKVVKTINQLRSPELLVFNLLNDHLKKLNVRKAIAHALDMRQIIKIHYGYANRVDSPVWFSSPFYKTLEYLIDYNYVTARDLMRAEGYFALETNNPCIDCHWYTETTDTTPEDNTTVVITVTGDNVTTAYTIKGDDTTSIITKSRYVSVRIGFVTAFLIMVPIIRRRRIYVIQ